MAGHAFALEVCSGCHLVADDQPTLPLTYAPTFYEVANTPGITRMALSVFLQSPHPTMPNLILKPDQANDVIAYILSLREP